MRVSKWQRSGWLAAIEKAEEEDTVDGYEMHYMPPPEYVKPPPFSPDPRWERIEV
jgi:hypothetical protein